jgi:hypothetical protein
MDLTSTATTVSRAAGLADLVANAQADELAPWVLASTTMRRQLFLAMFLHNQL